jgi:hypothetical protein
MIFHQEEEVIPHTDGVAHESSPPPGSIVS